MEALQQLDLIPLNISFIASFFTGFLRVLDARLGAEKSISLLWPLLLYCRWNQFGLWISLSKYLIENRLWGQVLIHKPLGWTSFQVVNKIRFFLKKQAGLKKLKVGHAGTLDPLATGLLLLCTGKKTKSISLLQAEEKEYTGSFYLGATTPSYDLETTPDKHFSITHLSPQQILEMTAQFTGEIEQFPPLYSALKKEKAL